MTRVLVDDVWRAVDNDEEVDEDTIEAELIIEEEEDEAAAEDRAGADEDTLEAGEEGQGEKDELEVWESVRQR
jgi:hypothetical protein